MPPDLQLDRDGPVVTLTLARPERRNALSRGLMRAIVEACTELRDDAEARVIVLRGAGSDFSVGVDLKDPESAELAGADLGTRRRAQQLGPRMVQAVLDLPQTTIVSMHGWCLGGGGCLALACDLRVMASDARFGMPEVQRGMNMSWRTVPLMVTTFGATRTKELLLTGRHVGADEALMWGLASRIVPGSGAEAHAEAARWATELAQSVPPLAAAMVKETVNAVATALTPMVHMDADQHLLAQHTEDFRESISAFLDKRPARFRGR